jgi:phosphoserine phosphatase
MTHVATLICNPAMPALDAAMVARARALLPAAGAVRWLAPDIAAEIGFNPEDGFDASTAVARLRDALAPAPVDVAVQPQAQRRKRLLVADMDSTMIGQECIDELADFAGLRAHVSAITERAMRGEIAFAPALRERVALLRGLPATIIDEVIAHRITLTPGGRALVATMRANGAFTALVSGGFTAFTRRIAEMLGFDDNRGNTLAVDADGKLAGSVAEPVLGREAKQQTLIAERSRLGLTSAETLAVGDGANDLAMIAEAGLGVAFRAKPAVAAAAAARIDHSDLTALLYLQGYTRDEFVG